MANMNVWVLGRNGKVRDYSETISFEVSPDYLTNEQSQFNLANKIDAQPNEFIVAKENGGTIPAYFGVVNSIDNGAIVTNGIMQLLNYQGIFERSLSGQSIEAFIKQMITDHFLSDNTKNAPLLTIDVRTNTSFYLMLNTQVEKYTEYNLTDLLIRAFQKYGVVWHFDDLEINQTTGVYTIHTSIAAYSNIIAIKDNSYSFINWDVYERPIGPSLENKALVFNTTGGQPPSTAVVYYLRGDNKLTQDPNDNVYHPTKDKVVLYDGTNETATPQELASSALLGNTYSHEINFDLKSDSQLIKFEDLNIGQKFNIIYKDSLYQSILTGYKRTSASDMISLKFGNYRSSFNQVLRHYSRRQNT